MFGASSFNAAEAQAERERLLLAAAVRTVFATENGKRLKDWLRTACFMDSPMVQAEIESTAATQRIAARRDLFITLELLEKEGANVSSDD